MGFEKIAVVLFNLGGPDSPESVRPFLFNLFNDPAIIGAPQPFRWLIAHLISFRRAPLAREIYANLGGKSPLLENTEAQARSLSGRLNADADAEYRVFIAMRYWHPMSDETAARIAAYDPDRVLLLPLYPHFSTTTTGSSCKEWMRAADKAGLRAPARAVCCYPTQPGMIAAMAKLIRPHLAAMAGNFPEGPKPRILFSAHGLPKRVVERGDPYMWQIEQTAALVVSELSGDPPAIGDFDWAVCYQSRVGPLEWIGPSTENEIVRGARDGVPLLVFPIAFVSEHSETLVELDIEYRRLAGEQGVPDYVRVPVLGADEDFIDALAVLVKDARDREGMFRSCNGTRLCPPESSQCPNRS